MARGEKEGASGLLGPRSREKLQRLIGVKGVGTPPSDSRALEVETTPPSPGRHREAGQRVLETVVPRGWDKYLNSSQNEHVLT